MNDLRVPARIASMSGAVPIPAYVADCDHEAWLAQLRDTIGTSSDEEAAYVLSCITRAVPDCPEKADVVSAILASIRGMAPADGMERLLVVQAAVANHIAMRALAEMARAGSPEAARAAEKTAVRFLRLTGQHADTVRRMRTGGVQTINVHYVDKAVVVPTEGALK